MCVIFRHSSNAVKICGAFVAGVVLTMGSLIYSRTHEHHKFPSAIRHQSLDGPANTVTRPADRAGAAMSAQAAKFPDDAKEAPAPSVRTLRHPQAQIAANSPAPKGIQAILPRTVEETSPMSVTVPMPQVSASRAQAVPHQSETPSTTRGGPKTATLPAGTNLTIRLEQSLSSTHSKKGHAFRGVLATPLVVDGFVVAERGSGVVGEIVAAKKAHLLGGKSDLRLTVTQITAADGQPVRVKTDLWEQQGSNSVLAATPKMAVGAVLGAVTGAARGAGLLSGSDNENQADAVAGHQRSVLLPTGAQLRFQLASAVTITDATNAR